jgi:6-phosphogluconate dehydrogenase
VTTKSYAEFAAALQKPRAALIMVQAGKGTDAVIDELVKVFEPGDIIVDGGNALYTDTIRREEAVRATGINFVGAGISGGEEGALNGPSIMPGGSDESWVTLGPILKSIAAVAEGEPCVTHVGHDGAGHFVKMIHNGIEYADMQLIAEAYDLIRRGTGKTPAEIADIFAEWNTGELESYLIEITAEVLRQVDAETGKPLVDVILDQAGSKGTGVWTVQNALDLGIPVSGIAEAVFARSLSSKPAQRAAASGLPGPAAVPPIADADAFIEDVRQALYASKIIAYSQGFDAIVAGAEEFDWDIKKGEIAKIWRGGCIIRARFLNRITEAYAADPGLVALVTAPFFVEVVTGTQEAWRRVVAHAAAAGIPSPAFSSSLAYYDGLRADRLPAALVQGQRDFFGAHTYGRVDKPGTFHTLWSGDRSEVQAADSH